MGAYEGAGGPPVVTFTVTASASPANGGTISPSGAQTVTQGGSQAFTITPAIGYQITNVTVNGVSQGAITNFTFNNVQANGTITAVFSQIPDGVPPSTPTNLAATAVSSTQVNLTWTASTDNIAVAGYKLFRNSQQIATPTVTNYQDSGLNASTPYTYTVQAVDSANNVSGQSNSAAVTTPASPPPGSGVAIDSSSPTRALNPINCSSSGSNTATTASFTAPANSLVIAAVVSDAFAVAPTISVGNSGTALTWTRIIKRDLSDGGMGGYAGAYYAKVGNSQTMTVNATVNMTCTVSVKVYVVTGADMNTPIGATVSGNSTSNNFSTTAYTSLTNTRGFVVASDYTPKGIPTSSDTVVDGFSSTGNVGGLSGYKSSNTSVSGNVSFNITAPSTGHEWNWVAFEIRSTNSTAAAPSQTLVAAALAPFVSIDTPAINGLTLINADTDKSVSMLESGDVIDYSTVGTNQINIKAEANAAVTGVQFTLDGVAGPIKTTAPFALATVNGTNYGAWTPTLGNHILVVTPFGAGSKQGIPQTVAFSVSNNRGYIPGQTQIASACVSLTNYLQSGSTDNATNGDVSKLQTYLKAQGFYTYPEITGYYGPTTMEAVKSFQTRYGIEAAGTVGPMTRAKIQELSCR
jgi:hypothetical protein